MITSTGSPLAPESFDFVYEAIKPDVHLASIAGGTDICSCFMLGNPLSPVYRGEIQGPGLGMAVDVFDDEGQPMASGKGELVCTKPFTAMPVGFLNDPGGAKYNAAYFERYPGVWHHGDFAEWTEHGGLVMQGRSDATLNPGGVRIGTAEIYRQVEQLDEVTEAIVIGQNWDNDVRVVLFVVLAEGVTARRRATPEDQGEDPRAARARGMCRASSCRWPTFRAPNRARSPRSPFAISCTGGRSRTKRRWPIRGRSTTLWI